MLEIEATNLLGAMQTNWEDMDTRRSHIQDVLLVETLRLVDPLTASLHETHLLTHDGEQRDTDRVHLLGDMLQVTKGRRLAFVDDFDFVDDLHMDHLDAAETEAVSQSTPEDAVAAAVRFLRRLQVQG